MSVRQRFFGTAADGCTPAVRCSPRPDVKKWLALRIIERVAVLHAIVTIVVVVQAWCKPFAGVGFRVDYAFDFKVVPVISGVLALLLLGCVIRCEWTARTTVAVCALSTTAVFPVATEFQNWIRDGELHPSRIDFVEATIGSCFIAVISLLYVCLPMLAIYGPAIVYAQRRRRRVVHGRCLGCNHQLLDQQRICPECARERPSSRVAPRVSPTHLQLAAICVATLLVPSLCAVVIVESAEWRFGALAVEARADGEPYHGMDGRWGYWAWTLGRGYHSHRD